MIVLETEFPSMARDLLTQPVLLEALVDELPMSDELQRLVERYSSNTDHNNESAAGPLLATDGRARTAMARRKLNEQLDGYLSKINAAGGYPTSKVQVETRRWKVATASNWQFLADQNGG